jgi:hypothetical protein
LWCDDGLKRGVRTVASGGGGGGVRDGVINKRNKDQKSNVGWNIVVNMPNTYAYCRETLSQHNNTTPESDLKKTAYRHSTKYTPIITRVNL